MTTTLQAARAMAEQAKRHADNCATEFNGQILRDLAAALLKSVEAQEELREYILARRPYDEPLAPWKHDSGTFRVHDTFVTEPLQVNERSMPPLDTIVRETQRP